MNVYLIEDNDDHAAITTDYLTQIYPANLKVRTQTRLHPALAEIQKSKDLDIIISDLSLPDSRAEETIALLSKFESSIPTIVLTTFNDELSVKKLLSSGVQEYLPKDKLSPQLLENSILNSIERKHALNRLKEQVEERELFCRSLSHDFNGPIRRIRQLTELVLLEESELSANGREDLKSVIGQAELVAKLVKGLENYMRVEHAEVPLKPVSLADVLDSVRYLEKGVLEKSNVKFVFDASLPTVVGSEDRLVLLFRNLVSNAIQYNESDSPRVEIGIVASDGDLVTIAVEDNGTGISEDMHEQVFQPFKSLDSKRQGSGLGLSIVRKIAEQMEGKVEIKKDQSLGTCFLVTLRLA